ncbi:HEAT repeat domain-containing protein [Haliscomenobacter sp.]|uniref:HEAT repeat domain-containing protein n=1 Tax=Haliscomenobacter sp. TaxID=2717303 RepID=UPI00336524D5
MMHDKTEMLLLEYLDGTLASAERQQLEVRLAQDADLRKNLEELRTVLLHLEQFPEQEPSKELDARFDTFLQAEKRQLQSPNWLGRIRSFQALSRVEWQVAATFALLIIGLGFGWFWRVNQQQQAEIAALRQEMRSTQKMLVLAMLEEPSASDRIQAVNVLEQEKADPKVIKALINTLNFDDMVNVRMKAAQALSTFSDDPMARKALISSLATQESPEVQITIIEILVALGDKRAVPSLRSMSEDEELMDFVRQQAAVGLDVLL